jgi:hypothetical protein
MACRRAMSAAFADCIIVNAASPATPAKIKRFISTTSVKLPTRPIGAGKIFRNAFASSARKTHPADSRQPRCQIVNDEKSRCCLDLLPVR